MELWIDAQLSPSIALWINENFPGITAKSVRSLGLLSATDSAIFQGAKHASAVVMTKDVDFVHLQRKLGPPPQLIWITSGNTSNKKIKAELLTHMPKIIALLRSGEQLVEVK